MYTPYLPRILAGALITIISLAVTAGESTLQFVPHDFETEQHGTIGAEIAYLDVPARHGDHNSPRMRLRVVRLPALDEKLQRPPIVYLAGGPGGSGVGAARGRRWPVFDEVRKHADVLLLDQRGTGLSGRIDECPYRHTFEPGQSADPKGYLSELNAVAARCVELWRSKGIDLDAYNTIDSAHDIESLRVALGAERISLWGTSYGTHLAMAVLRLHGEHIDRSVMMGVEGPDDTLKLPLSADALLEELEDRLQRDGETKLDKNLIAMLQRVLSRLEQSPVQARVRRPFDTRVLTIGKFDAQLAVAAAVSRVQTARLLPLALSEADRGNYDVLAEFVQAVRQELGSFNAMQLAMDSSSGASADRRARIAQGERDSVLGPALNFPFPGISANLGIQELDASFRAPIKSAVPTLFISGSLDGRTPPVNAEVAATGFANGRLLVIDGAGHDNDLWLSDPAIPATIASFFAGAPISDTALVAPHVQFADSVVAEIWRALVMDHDGSIRGVAVAAGAVVLIMFAAVFYGISRMIKNRHLPYGARALGKRWSRNLPSATPRRL